MGVVSKRIQTAGKWLKITDIFDITMTNDKLYAIQIIGEAKLSYSSDIPTTNAFTINFTTPFTYEKKSGEDLYIKTDNANVAIGGPGIGKIAADNNENEPNNNEEIPE